MISARAIRITGDGRYEVDDRALNHRRPGWVLLKVLGAGLCGTDVAKAFSRRLPRGHTRILGHEVVGEILDMDAENADFKSGDIVVGMPLLPCEGCSYCREDKQNLCIRRRAIGRTEPGAFASHVYVPVGNILRVGDVTRPDVYTLADALAVCIHATTLDRRMILEKRVLVIGDGTIGSLLCWYLKRLGHQVFIKGRHKSNLDFMAQSGVNIVAGGLPTCYFDVVYETVGRSQEETIAESFASVKDQGQIVVLGVFEEGFSIDLVLRSMFIREVGLCGANSYTRAEFEHAVRIIDQNSPELECFISHRIMLESFATALSTMRDKQEFTLKIVLHPSRSLEATRELAPSR